MLPVHTDSSRSLPEVSPQPVGSRMGRRAVTRRESLCTRLMKVVAVACALFNPASAAGALNWHCPTPEGSYLLSCAPPVGRSYSSPDPNLSGIQFCRYNFVCDKLDGETRNTVKVLSRPDVGCGASWENCNGHLIARGDRIQRCKDRESIQAELEKVGLDAEEGKKVPKNKSPLGVFAYRDEV